MVEFTDNRISFVRISCNAKLFDKVPRNLYLPGLKKHDSRGSGEGVPTDLRGKLTESQLRKSKNLAKRRLQKVRTKSKKRKRLKAEPSESDKFSEKATAESPYEKHRFGIESQKTRKTMGGKRSWSNPGKTGQEKLIGSNSSLPSATLARDL